MNKRDPIVPLPPPTPVSNSTGNTETVNEMCDKQRYENVRTFCSSLYDVCSIKMVQEYREISNELHISCLKCCIRCRFGGDSGD